MAHSRGSRSARRAAGVETGVACPVGIAVLHPTELPEGGLCPYPFHAPIPFNGDAMKHPGWSTLAAQITAHAFAFTLLLAPAALADATSGRRTVPATSQFGPYFAELVNSGGSSLILSSNGVVTECSGRLGGSNKPGLGCKNIGSIFVPPSGGPYASEGTWPGQGNTRSESEGAREDRLFM